MVTTAFAESNCPNIARTFIEDLPQNKINLESFFRKRRFKKC